MYRNICNVRKQHTLSCSQKSIQFESIKNFSKSYFPQPKTWRVDVCLDVYRLYMNTTQICYLHAWQNSRARQQCRRINSLPANKTLRETWWWKHKQRKELNCATHRHCASEIPMGCMPTLCVLSWSWVLQIVEVLFSEPDTSVYNTSSADSVLSFFDRAPLWKP